MIGEIVKGYIDNDLHLRIHRARVTVCYSKPSRITFDAWPSVDFNLMPEELQFILDQINIFDSK